MIVTGEMEILSAVALRRDVPNEFWAILLGVITLGFGVYVAFDPGLSLLALVYTVGFYAIFAGIALIGLSFRLKNASSRVAQLHRTA